jgi:hypothetical protein
VHPLAWGKKNQWIFVDFFFAPLDTQLVHTIYMLGIQKKKGKNDARHFKK